MWSGARGGEGGRRPLCGHRPHLASSPLSVASFTCTHGRRGRRTTRIHTSRHSCTLQHRQVKCPPLLSVRIPVVGLTSRYPRVGNPTHGQVLLASTSELGVSSWALFVHSPFTLWPQCTLTHSEFRQRGSSYYSPDKAGNTHLVVCSIAPPSTGSICGLCAVGTFSSFYSILCLQTYTNYMCLSLIYTHTHTHIGPDRLRKRVIRGAQSKKFFSQSLSSLIYRPISIIHTLHLRYSHTHTHTHLSIHE